MLQGFGLVLDWFGHGLCSMCLFLSHLRTTKESKTWPFLMLAYLVWFSLGKPKHDQGHS